MPSKFRSPRYPELNQSELLTKNLGGLVIHR